MTQRVLVIGSGGREHAIAWKLSTSSQVEKVTIAPGNPGMRSQKLSPIDLSQEDFQGLLKFAEQVDLTVVGPEIPLAKGIADLFREKGLPIVGVGRSGARLEASKIFAKEFMSRHDIPTAPFRKFSDPESATEFARSKRECVIKADALAAGKGVIVCHSSDDAEAAVASLFASDFFKGELLIEDFLSGEELSYLALVDGETTVPFGMARDYKRVLDGDLGPNTGGMGAFSPVPGISGELTQKIEERILQRVAMGLVKEGIPYQGILYIGLMIVSGEPYVLEFNVRMGDPETQPILMRLKSDLYEIFSLLAAGRLCDVRLEWDAQHSLCVVMSAKGYPGVYERGIPIRGLEQLKESESQRVFHAGTIWDEKKNSFMTQGGRVLGVTAKGATLNDARNKAYAIVETIDWPGCHYRKDIGLIEDEKRDSSPAAQNDGIGSEG